MDAINAKKPDDKFYFSESNAEPYVKSFDGFLTWAWVYPNMVPFFPKVYAGHIAMLGRNTNGYKKKDRQYFRFHVGQAVMFGQQIGWINDIFCIVLQCLAGCLAMFKTGYFWHEIKN